MAKSKFSKIATNPRFLIVFAAILVAMYSTGIPFSILNQGIVVKAVERGSAAYDAGLRIDSGMESVIAVDGNAVKTVSEFESAISGSDINQTIRIQTNRNYYTIEVRPLVVNNETIGPEELGITVADVPKTNLKLGLDIQGGSRVLLAPETPLPEEDLALLIANMNRRLNLFGLSDVVVRDATDFRSNQQLILVEIAGANEQEVRQLIAKQGKFEAKISNHTIFTGTDIVDVCKSATCAGLDPSYGCQQASVTEWNCRFYFTITLSREAAQRQADATAKLDIDQATGSLSEPLQLYLDDELVEELKIDKDLKGNAVTTVSVTGSGTGATRSEAANNAIGKTGNMKRLQTILVTGSLPVKLQVARTDSISPILGEQFLRNAMKVGLIAILFVVLVLLLAYRKLQIAIPVMFTSLLEIFIMLGFAALPFWSWTIDLSAIAGIIAAVGTGVNDQIIITDEALRGGHRRIFSWKEKFKAAFSVIFGAYLTLIVAMLPLFVVGAGMLKGFALTTIIGMSVGVFITRPAYAKVIEILMERD